MKITDIRLQGYRNYKSAELHLHSGLNILKGKNAQGKTNVLESVCLCSVGRSPKTKKDKDLIHFEEACAHIELQFESGKGKGSIRIYLDRKTNKRILYNGVPLSRISELVGQLNSIYFSPDELGLIKNSPADRRKFLDTALCQLSHEYYYALSQYNTLLANRNSLLKNCTDTALLNIYDGKLAAFGAKIIKKRLGLTKDLKNFAEREHAYLSGQSEKLDIVYQTVSLSEEEKTLESDLYQQLLNTRDKDRKLGFTTVGPHRDDLKISINNIDIRGFGSQGQQRTAALSLKLAESEIFYQYKKEYPILLLDDVLSELDPHRQALLFARIENRQTLLTSVDHEIQAQYPYREFTIVNGTVAASVMKNTTL